jgi:cytochrome c oxidase subunit 2
MKFLFLLKIPTFSALSFQNANAPLIEELIFFHDHIITALILITLVVSYSIVSIIINSSIDKTSTESQSLEIF